MEKGLNGGYVGTSINFAAGAPVIDFVNRGEIIQTIDKSFSTLGQTVKTSMAKGNDPALVEFNAQLEALYWTALKLVAGKTVIHNG